MDAEKITNKIKVQFGFMIEQKIFDPVTKKLTPEMKADLLRHIKASPDDLRGISGFVLKHTGKQSGTRVNEMDTELCATFITVVCAQHPGLLSLPCPPEELKGIKEIIGVTNE